MGGEARRGDEPQFGLWLRDRRRQEWYDGDDERWVCNVDNGPVPHNLHGRYPLSPKWEPDINVV